MKAEQVSFAAGEISPVLHARTDLTRYRIGLAELVNMIVLPQGGVTRRAGLWASGTINAEGVKLIPFEYNTTDGVMLEFGDKIMRVWRKVSASRFTTTVSISTPYALADVKKLRYVQSGNVMFLTHRNYKPMMLRRNSLSSWTLQELPYRGGPWISGEEWASGVKLRFSNIAASKVLNSIGGNVFSGNVTGSLMKVEYAVAAQTMELTSSTSGTETEPFEVKGTMNVTTAGDWIGLIQVDRSADGGNTWVTVRQYVRKNIDTQGQWDFTISETEDNVLYKVKAQHEEHSFSDASANDSGNNGSGGNGSGDNGGNTSVTYPEHPDIEGGENYINREYWYSKGGYDAARVELSDGRTCYYSYKLHQTFYVVGHTGIGQYDGIYGYVVDGYPDGYDENGNPIEG